jgi:hypothetical protein
MKRIVLAVVMSLFASVAYGQISLSYNPVVNTVESPNAEYYEEVIGGIEITHGDQKFSTGPSVVRGKGAHQAATARVQADKRGIERQTLFNGTLDRIGVPGHCRVRPVVAEPVYVEVPTPVRTYTYSPAPYVVAPVTARVLYEPLPWYYSRP